MAGGRPGARVRRVQVCGRGGLGLATLVALVGTMSWSGDVVAKKQLVYWTAADGQVLEAYKAAAAAFNARQKDIEVRVEQIGGWAEKIMVSVAAGTPPDVFNDWQRVTMRERIELGAYQSLTRLIERDKYPIDRLNPAALAQATFNGEIWGLPLTGTVVPVFYWNKDLLNAAGLDGERGPADWDEIVRYNDKLTVIGPDRKMTRIGYAPTEGHIGDRWHFFVLQNGGEIASPDARRVEGYINSPAAVEAITWAANLATRYGWGTFDEFRRTWGSGAQEAFVSRRAAMWGGSSPQAVRGILLFDPDFPLGWALHPAPKGRPRIILIEGSANAIPKGVKDVDAAWEFVKFMSGQEQTQLSRLVGYQSAHLGALLATREVLSSLIALQSYPHTKAHPITVAEEFYRAEMNRAKLAIVRGQLSPKAALDEVARRVQAQIDEILARRR